MTNTLRLTSPSFENNAELSSKFTCDGDNVSPALSIIGVPPAAKSLVLIMDDPDAPGRTWVHWVRWNIPPTTVEIIEGVESLGVSGLGSSNQSIYQGPCPPTGTHRYFFKLYALDAELTLPPGATKAEVEQAMKGHILDQTELIGNYKRKFDQS